MHPAATQCSVDRQYAKIKPQAAVLRGRRDVRRVRLLWKDSGSYPRAYPSKESVPTAKAEQPNYRILVPKMQRRIPKGRRVF